MNFPDSADARFRVVTRRGVLTAAAGAIVVIGTGCYRIAEDERTAAARAELRPDGRSRLPPGQRLIEHLRDMGGDAGDPDPARWSLRVYGEVRKPLRLDYADLLSMPQSEDPADVHCVTRWSCLDRTWKGVRIRELADRAGVHDTARYVIFEAANGYTANVPIQEALAENAMLAHHLDGDPLPPENGGPVRGLVPDLYFWKSAKWLTGIRFVEKDEPGYWEVRGYHNHGDPWREERHG